MTVLLVVITITGGLFAWSTCRPGRPVEIILPPEEQTEGSIAVSGAVANPGYYPVTGTDSLEAILAAAGGLTENASLGDLRLFVPQAGNTTPPQRIDINRAEAWLLEVLPGIGPTRAQAIVQYRQQNGPFRTTSELTRVEGIGPAIYEGVIDLITVAE